jgi:hypothetical protein
MIRIGTSPAVDLEELYTPPDVDGTPTTLRKIYNLDRQLLQSVLSG